MENDSLKVFDVIAPMGFAYSNDFSPLPCHDEACFHYNATLENATSYTATQLIGEHLTQALPPALHNSYRQQQLWLQQLIKPIGNAKAKLSPIGTHLAGV